MSTPIDTYCRLQKAEDNYKADLIFVILYQSIVGSIMYIMLGTQPDIAYAVLVVSRYRSNPTSAYHRVVKRIFQYLKGTKDLQLTYRGDLQPLLDYTDSNWTDNHDTQRSTFGYVFNVSNKAIS